MSVCGTHHSVTSCLQSCRIPTTLTQDAVPHAASACENSPGGGGIACITRSVLHSVATPAMAIFSSALLQAVAPSSTDSATRRPSSPSLPQARTVGQRTEQGARECFHAGSWRTSRGDPAHIRRAGEVLFQQAPRGDAPLHARNKAAVEERQTVPRDYERVSRPALSRFA